MVEKYWQKCYSHSPDKEEITPFQTQWEEKSWNVIQDGLMCPKAFLLFFFSFSAILIGLLKNISFIDILRSSQHNNLLHNLLSKFVAAYSECAWLESLCLVLRVAAGDEEPGLPVLEHSSSAGPALPRHCGFTAPSQSFPELPHTCYLPYLSSFVVGL